MYKIQGLVILLLILVSLFYSCVGNEYVGNKYYSLHCEEVDDIPTITEIKYDFISNDSVRLSMTLQSRSNQIYISELDSFITYSSHPYTFKDDMITIHSVGNSKINLSNIYTTSIVSILDSSEAITRVTNSVINKNLLPKYLKLLNNVPIGYVKIIKQDKRVLIRKI